VVRCGAVRCRCRRCDFGLWLGGTGSFRSCWEEVEHERAEDDIEGIVARLDCSGIEVLGRNVSQPGCPQIGEHLGRDVSWNDVSSRSDSSTDRKAHRTPPGSQVQDDDALAQAEADPLRQVPAGESEEPHGLVVGGQQSVGAFGLERSRS
jgi:hypothetical protein